MKNEIGGFAELMKKYFIAKTCERFRHCFNYRHDKLHPKKLINQYTKHYIYKQLNLLLQLVDCYVTHVDKSQ